MLLFLNCSFNGEFTPPRRHDGASVPWSAVEVILVSLRVFQQSPMFVDEQSGHVFPSSIVLLQLVN